MSVGEPDVDPRVAVVDDLRAEGDQLDLLVGELPPERWGTPTPAEGWTIAHQIGHLWWTDQQSLLALDDPEAFQESARQAMEHPDSFVDLGATERADRPPESLLHQWREARATLAVRLAELPRGRKLPWYGPPMSGPSMATARLMETWAHGQDVAQALGVRPEPTARLRHVVRLGVRTRDFAHLVRGLTPPQEPFRLELRAPDSGLWTEGPEDAAQRVTGSALDFCLLVTQRVHRQDTDLTAQGPDAERWLDIAQAFAGPPGPGRPPRGTATGAGDR
ncbi:TIGR03084 family metal-binding protein [Streptomyces sp. NPDC005438]|uniref:TIGR03084 family metal-binding protein n=1 Tax=Streptomyces sp. NPDC005438 TaxID=3156880 RepID=UPI0033B68E02